MAWACGIKKTLRAQEQESGENLWRRQAWWELVAEIDPACLVFLDESGVTTEMTRRYGWGPRSERVREAVPAGHWRTLTVLAALTTEGVLASMSIESPTDGDVFLAFVEQVLAPRLQPGHLVILDNLGAHKVDGVRELIEKCGGICSICHPTPPTSTPSNKPGPSSNNCYVESKRGCSINSNQPSPGHRRHHSRRRTSLLPSLRLSDIATMKML